MILLRDEPFQTIDVFASQHTDVSESFLSNIDEKISALVDAHKAIFDRITETIADIDYNNQSIKFGGEQ